MRVDTPEEDAFLAKRLWFPAWIGANDREEEGRWQWTDDGSLFFEGGPHGTPVEGAYTNWFFGQPDDFFGEDCAIHKGHVNAWWDVDCRHRFDFVCEVIDRCPFDPDKNDPGQCGCHRPDTDRDGDGVADCVDQCPRDPDKDRRGICGCLVPDEDADGDGVPDCEDDATGDPSIQVAGSCGTAADPAPAGTPCDDGPCPGVFTCDGAGQCGEPTCAPPGGGDCVFRRFRGKDYWFCDGPLDWDAAAEECRAQFGRSLVRIESQAENAFVAASLGTESWIGANDTAGDQVWRWSTESTDGGPRFWIGGADGAPYFAAYAEWATGAPASRLRRRHCRRGGRHAGGHRPDRRAVLRQPVHVHRNA